MHVPFRKARFRPLVGIVLGLIALFTVGCGGGGSANAVGGSSPTQQTRSAMTQLQRNMLRSLAQSGVQSASAASIRNGVGGAADGVTATNGGGTASSVPMLGAFIHNVAAATPAHRAARRHHPRTTRDVNDGSDGSDGSTGSGVSGGSGGGSGLGSGNSFYYDEWLGLWVDYTEAATQTTYTFYEDQGKTKPAGSNVTTFPADWNTYPQVYASIYTFTAGFLKGTHGSYQTTQKADNSGSSRYDDTYSDGWSDSGTSDWSATGDSNCQSRSDGPNKAYYLFKASFKSDGSGTTHTEGSDGFISDYSYHADGSGSGRISGPLAGLPATITWDAFGNTTIRYADGTVETYNGWGYDDGTTSSGDGSGNSSSSSSATPAPPGG